MIGRPMRTRLLLAVVFPAGILYAGRQQDGGCAATGGEMTAGLCMEARG